MLTDRSFASVLFRLLAQPVKHRAAIAMLATVSTVQSLPETGHLARVAGQLFLRSDQFIFRFCKFIFQGFYDVLHQNAGGMFSVVYAHRLGIGLGLLGFSLGTFGLRIRFQYGSLQRYQTDNGSQQAATQNPVEYHAHFHATRSVY